MGKLMLTLDEMNRRIAARDAERDRDEANRKARIESEAADELVSRIVRRNMPTPGPKRIPAKRKPAPVLSCAICAICVAQIPRPTDAPDDWTPRQEPLGRDDAMVSICEDCATGLPRERDHLFSSRGAVGRDGVGESNRRGGSGWRGK